MNNYQMGLLRKKINKFANRAHMMAWHNNVLFNIKHRFSLKRSEIEFHSRYLSIPHPNDVYVLTTNNDLFLITSRDVREVEEWEIEPNDIYTWIAGEDGMFQLEWDVITQVPTSLLNSILTIFKEYFDVKIDYPVLTIAIPHRIPHQIHDGEVIFLPNANLFPIEYEWVLKMQKSLADGKEVPPRPEVLLGERLQPLYEGLEWNGEGAE